MILSDMVRKMGELDETDSESKCLFEYGFHGLISV